MREITRIEKENNAAGENAQLTRGKLQVSNGEHKPGGLRGGRQERQANEARAP